MSHLGSQMSREDMLRELELLPVWQLRQPLPMPFKVEATAADKSGQAAAEQAVNESVAQEQEIPAVALPVIEIAAAESAELELSIPASSIPEPVPSVPFVPEAPVIEVQVIEVPAPQQIEVVGRTEEVPIEEPVLQQVQSLPLRLLLSEDSTYAFLIEPYAAEADVQQIETLLKNMIRAMQVSCRVDVTDAADKIFAIHTPKLIVSLGAEPANHLSGKTHVIDEWRSIQQQNQPRYEQIPLIVTYHPAHLLKNTADKAHAWHDLCAAMKLVQSL